MLAAGLAISGGGQTTFELAATGTPTVAIRLADNQTLTLETLAEAGALIQAGDAGDPALADAVAAAVERLIKDGDRRLEMSERARAAVDGQGAARVAREILALQAAA
jgi:UDP-2,4-diacetamido-2,4,6-trideoxy-beta-L-altropyranose hydrolase